MTLAEEMLNRLTYSGITVSTTWSTYADQIRAIEDYPDITGGDS